MQPTINSRYRITDLIGGGGMGQVFRATDRLTGNPVAIKRIALTPSAAADATPALAFQDYRAAIALSKEFQILAGLRHPHIVPVLDYGFDSVGLPFFTMPLLEEALPLDRVYRTRNFETRIAYVLQLLLTLTYVHRHGVLHRDIKPSNVLVGADDHLYLLDFGVAVEAAKVVAGQTAGTLSFMAPEIVRGETPTPASDLFSVGVVLYVLLTGVNPFSAPSPNLVMQNILTLEPNWVIFKGRATPHAPLPLKRDEPEDATGTLILAPVANFSPQTPMPASLETSRDSLDALLTVAQTLLAKDPAQRYPTAEAAITALCAALDIPAPIETQEIYESFLQSSRFVGRKSELTRLSEAVDALHNGKGSAWLIGGESGIGKSRLLNEVAIQAMVQDIVVLRGQAVNAGGLRFQLWRDPLRHLVLARERELDALTAGVLKLMVPDIERLLQRPVPDAPEISGAAAQDRIKWVIRTLFQYQRPVLLLLEDLHWADTEIDMLHSLNELVGTQPLMIVGSFRSDEAAELPIFLAEMTLLPLERLDESAIAEMSANMLGEGGKNQEVVDLLWHQTEGNSFFLVETIRALVEESGQLSEVGRRTLPPNITAKSVEEILQRRLQRLTPINRPLLKLAAVLGRELDVKILQAACAADPALNVTPQQVESWVLQGVYAAVLEPRGEGWRFQHDLLRESLLRSLPADEKMALHRQAAESIETAYPDDANYAPALLNHWREAKQLEKEAIYLQQVAREWMNFSRYREVIALLEEATPRLVQRPQWATLMNKWGGALTVVGDFAQAETKYEQALAAAEQSGVERTLADALRGLGWLGYQRGDADRAEEFLRRAETVSRQLNDREGVARALLCMGAVYGNLRGDLEAMAGLYDEILTIGRELENWDILSSGLNDKANVEAAMGESELAIEHLQEAAKLAEKIGNRRDYAVATGNVAFVYVTEEKFEEGLQAVEPSIAMLREIGDIHFLCILLHLKLRTLLGLGRDEEGIKVFVEGLSLTQKHGLQNLILEFLRLGSKLALRQGHPEIAGEWLAFLLYHEKTPESYREHIEEHQQEVIEAIGQAVAEASFARGRQLAEAQVVAQAHELFGG